MFCVEALCKLQSVLVPLTLAIGVLAESFLHLFTSFYLFEGGSMMGCQFRYQKH